MKKLSEFDFSAITVGPDEVLVITASSDAIPPDSEEGNDFLDGLMDQFVEMGLKGRVLLICGDGVHMAKVQR